MEHKTPSTEIFNEIKEAAIRIWSTYDDTYGYRTEKLTRVNSLSNYEDNIMVCYRMFDSNNQAKMRMMLSDEALEYVYANN